MLQFMKPTIACMLVLVTFLMGCDMQQDEVEPQGLMADEQVSEARHGMSHVTLQEIAMLRAAIARYHDIDKAIADGYYDEFTGYRSRMGYHYLYPELLDYEFELTRPEVLVYAPSPNGGLRLVAVEYAMKVDDLKNPPPAPEGYTGDADVWALNSEFSVWTLHVWIGLNNPDGIFAPRNPRLP